MRKRFVVSALAACALGISVIAVPTTALAKGSKVVYDSIPAQLPGNLASWSFEATQTSQFGDQVTLAGSARTLTSVTVTMSSWGCESGNWYNDNCATTPGNTFSVPITFNVYNVGVDGTSVGTQLATVTQSFNIPYRPSASSKCTGAQLGEWYDGKQGCFNGLANNITFTGFSSVLLPNTVIFGVAFNTSDYGAVPQRPQPCNDPILSPQGCGYDSLNVALSQHVGPGSRPYTNSDYLSSTYGGEYCDNGNGGTGSFRYDSVDTSTTNPGMCGPAGNPPTLYTPAAWFGGYFPAVQFIAT
jgi:hypothetical protein